MSTQPASAVAPAQPGIDSDAADEHNSTRWGRKLSVLTRPPLEHAVLLVIGYLCLQFLFNSDVDYLLMVFVAVYGVATLGLSMVFGLGGMLSVAQGALVGVGAYTSALLMTKSHWPFLAAAVGGILVTSAISTIFTLLAARVRTHYFVLVSLAVAQVLNLIEQGASFTGGNQGLGGIPPISAAGHAVTTPYGQAMVGLVVLIFAWYLTDVFKRSRLGRAVFVAGLNEELARTSGVNVLGSRLAVAAMGGALAGVGGVLFASTVSYLDPSTFSVNLSLLFLVSIVVGGMNSIPWTVAAAVLFTYLNNGLSSLTTVGPLIYGLAVVVVLLVAPGGVASVAERGWEWAVGALKRNRSGPSPERSVR